MHPYSNRLVNESSPYLQQHAHNPVDWHPWGEEALELARREDKPILVSIGYAACHWCHVMERESFEDPEVAALMNNYFINIKVDREERPDVDHIYMDALQAMTGSGGWPLNVFLTSDARPFYGGTYFPPRPFREHMAWKDVVEGVAKAYRERRDEVETQANALTGHLTKTNSWGLSSHSVAPAEDVFSLAFTTGVFEKIMSMADRENGGFGRAPKFPQTFMINYLLHHYYYTKNPAALEHACLTLDKMLGGGIYDQLQGGFARYATDDRWLVPHFEKMLYDNALLISTLCQAYQCTRRQEYLLAVESTIEFITSEWLKEEGGFCAAYDADSEGEEGRYYVWTRKEIEEVIGEETELFCDYYQVNSEGNWEGKSILHVPLHLDQFAASRGLSKEEADRRLGNSRRLLLRERSKRVKPLLDDKILLGWNALMVSALCAAFSITGKEVYRKQAIHTLEFLSTAFFDGKNWLHSYKEGRARHFAFLDDLAYLIEALINLQEITGEQRYLEQAQALVNYVMNGFSEADRPYFYYTHADQKDLIVRKVEVYDGATPSGNAVMARNLYALGVLLDNTDWRERSVQMVQGLFSLIEKYPSSFGVWAELAQGFCRGIPEIVLVGPNFNHLLIDFLCTFIPHKIFQCATLPDNCYPLLSKPVTIEPQFYLCKNFKCAPPVKEVGDLVKMLTEA